MERWEFLIQQEGDTGWRPIKATNLQLMEGKYRIIANSNLSETQIQTQITYQVTGKTGQTSKSQSRTHGSNAKGLVVIIPFTELRSGVWQFACSQTDPPPNSLPQILHLKILPNSKTISPVAPHSLTQNTSQSDVPTPTAPLIPLPNFTDSDSGDGTLERLFKQIERDLLQPRQPSLTAAPQVIELIQLKVAPLRLIDLDRSTFADMTPTDRLKISGACNLQLVNDKLIQDGIVTKLSICLCHSQTGVIVAEIMAKVPPHLDRFAFNCELKLPTESTTNLFIGEVSLYDLDRNQVGSCGFTVTLAINPLPEFDLSFLNLLEEDFSSTENLLAPNPWHRLTEAVSPQPSEQLDPAPIDTSYPSVPIAYRRESLFAKYPEIQPVKPSIVDEASPVADRIYPQYPHPSQHRDTEIELELEPYPSNGKTLEIVSDD